MGIANEGNLMGAGDWRTEIRDVHNVIMHSP